jgi:hypothetical protein
VALLVGSFVVCRSSCSDWRDKASPIVGLFSRALKIKPKEKIAKYTGHIRCGELPGAKTRPINYIIFGLF